MEKKFIEIGELNIHYRYKGSGKVLILLHPSPRNSKMMEPLINLLSSNFLVIAPDLPGYGISDALPERIKSIYDYVPYLHKLITSITEEPVRMYGTATGAQLAIAYSLINSKNVAHLFLDNAAHFEEAECEEILQNYFPDLSEQKDGSHLQKIWNLVCDSCLYFPWYKKDEKHRIGNKLPPTNIIQAIVDDYVLAGANYADAYIAAFKHERAEKVQQLTCDTTILKWLGSPIVKHINALLAYEFKNNIKVIETPIDMKLRYEVIKEVIIKS
jgi:pimeloyl-ACP methyl ester carboxylesterase